MTKRPSGTRGATSESMATARPMQFSGAQQMAKITNTMNVVRKLWMFLDHRHGLSSDLTFLQARSTSAQMRR